jgi:DHA1 family multidrug resistance protein-like MFS transporter
MRDTAFGQIIRVASGRRFFKYPEEEDHELWKQFIDEKKSANLARHGTVEPPEEDDEKSNADSSDDRRQPPREDSDSSSRTHVGDDQPTNEASGVKVDPENGKDINLVTWYGPDDPENPQNWSTAKKFFVTFELCLLTTSIYIGSSIYSAGTQSVMATFGVSQVAATLGLCLFVAGYGLGPMIFSPMSEIPQVGRNPVYLITLAIFVGFQAPTARATNFSMLLAFRFLTGFFGSPVLATGGASLGDMYAPSKRAYAMSIWGISAICGPTLGPLVG